MELLKNIKELAVGTADAFNIYLEKLALSGFFGVEPFLTDIAQKNIKFVLDNADTITLLIEKTHDYHEIFQLVGLVNEFHDRLAEVYKIFTENRLNVSQQGMRTSRGSQLSYTYLVSLSDSFMSISQIFSTYTAETKNMTIMKFLSQQTEVHNLKDIEKLQKLYKEYFDESRGQYIIDFYCTLLQKIIDDFTSRPDGREIIKQIIKDVENLKTDTLVSGISPSDEKNKSVNTIQRLIQKFGLVPDAMSRPLADLWKELGLTTATGKLDLPAQIAKAATSLSRDKDKKFGFIIISKIIKQPIEYNIWVLIDQNYLEQHDLIQEKSSGINAKALDRGKTITMKAGESIKKLDNIIVHNNDFGSDMLKNFYYVIETLDGVNFRFLVAFDNIKYIPAPWLNDITNIEKTPSRRIEGYSNLLNDEILKYLEKPYVQMENLSRAEVAREDIYWSNLRGRIKNAVIDNIMMNIISSSINMKHIEQVLSKDTIVQKIIREITEQIVLDLSEPQSSPDRLDQWRIELFLAYFRDIDKLQKSFKHTLTENLRKDFAEKISQLLGGGTVPESKQAMIKHKLIDIISDMLLATLEKFINKKSSVYLSINKKVELLQNTLLMHNF